MRLKKNEKNLFMATIALAAMASLYVFVVEPIIVKRATLSDRVKAKHTLLLKDKRLMSQYSMIKERYDRYPEFIRNVTSEEEASQILREIERSSKEASCSIIDVKPRPVSKRDLFKEISIEVTGEGSIEAISKFLYGLETSKSLITIQRLHIAARSDIAASLRAVFIVRKLIFT